MSARSIDQTLLVFVDEKIERLDSSTRWIVGCCLFGLNPWVALHSRAHAVGAVRGKRRLKEIDKLLNTVGGVAVLVHADVPQELIPKSEIDGTGDIRRMSRTDNIWSQTVLSALTASVAWLQHCNVPLGKVEIYYDRKDLKDDHRSQIENVLRQNLPKWAKYAAENHPSMFPADCSNLSIDKIASVEKPLRGRQPDMFQVGINLVDHLCRQSKPVMDRGSEGRILVRNHTGVVCDITSKFTLSSNEK